MFKATKKLILFILLTASGTCLPQKIFSPLDHAGAYLAASNINEKLNESICGKFIEQKNPITTEKAISDIRKKLNKEDLSEFNSYISSFDYKEKMMKNKYFIDSFILNAKNKQIDFKFSCGLLTGLIITTNEPIFQKWSQISDSIIN